MDSVTASLTVSPVNMCGAWSTALLLLALTLPAALSVNVAPLFEPAGTQARRTLVAGAPAAAPAAARSPKHRARQLLQQADKPALTHFGGMDMEDMVPEGYPIEKHRVNTEDGWVLNMYRIPHGKYRNSQPGPRPVVLLHHGITLSSACFALLNANESMAYILADAGFDVWMANTRSNTFSRGNYNYSHRQSEYWYHSIDEYGLIDLPAQVNAALQVAGAKKLAIVGHSQGCSVAYAMLSTMPEMNSRVSVVAHLGPVVFLDYFRAPFMKAMGEMRNDLYARTAKIGEFLWYRFVAPYIDVCRDYYNSEFCTAVLNLTFFGPSMFITPDETAVIFKTWPASVSMRNVGHWAQMLTDGQLRFQRYDFGSNCGNLTNHEETCNQHRYGSMQPPEYDLSKVTAPQAFFAGELDLMATTEDILEQQRRLAPGVHAADYIYQSYSHMDFVWDRSARHALDLVDLLFRYAPGTL